MNIEVDKTGTLRELDKIIDKLLGSGSKSIILLSCDKNNFTPSDIKKSMQNVPVPVFGGIFPAIIVNTEKIDNGTIALGCSKKIETVTIPDLEANAGDIESIIETRFSDSAPIVTVFIFVDAFSRNISRLIDGMFNIFGLEINYIGCGAGSLSMKQKPCLFTNQGLIQNAAVIAATSSSSGIGVKHGWQSVEGPYRVTTADGNTIQTLDWKPAYDVYRDAVEKISNESFANRNFYDISKSFPFGITKLGAERVVRDPIIVNKDKSLICVGEVPEGAFVDILHGDEDSLLQAVDLARHESETQFGREIQDRFILFIDCISRVLFLGDKFKKELKKVYQPGFPLVGACTIGEIANTGNQYLEFYNKTSVVAHIESL